MIRKYFRDSVKELNNVTWPTRDQAIRITKIVFVFMVVSAIVLGVIDFLLTEGFQRLLSL